MSSWLLSSLSVIWNNRFTSWVSSWMWTIRGGRPVRVLLLGLDNSGKTTLLHLLKTNYMGAHFPTVQPTQEELSIGSLKMTTVDMGGHKVARDLWRSYYTSVDGIVFLVDVSDTNRLAEAKYELDQILQEDVIDKVPILVLGNKIDQQGAISEYALREQLNIFCSDNRLHVQMCSLLHKQGYAEGLLWLAGKM